MIGFPIYTLCNCSLHIIDDRSDTLAALTMRQRERILFRAEADNIRYSALRNDLSSPQKIVNQGSGAANWQDFAVSQSYAYDATPLLAL